MVKIFIGHLPPNPDWTFEDQQRALAAVAESMFGLTVLGWQQPPGQGLESITVTVQDPQTGEQGSIMLPSWLLKRLVYHA